MTVSLHSAGHILGSSQFLIENGSRVVYTGDIRLYNNGLIPPAEIIPCDTLIIESTYGLPHFKFPKIEDVSAQITAWVNKEQKSGANIVFGAYKLGKSQELIHILNEAGVTPVVHPDIYANARIYEKNGVKLGEFISTSSPEAGLNEQFVAIVPPSIMDSFLLSGLGAQYGRDVKTALVTGWGIEYGFQGIDKVFCLSDHADFWQLLRYVKESGAKTVYTVHGYDKDFAEHLNHKLKIGARPLRSAKNKLLDFIRV
jgi:Cft2 family RNA processing exonuclease